MAPAERDTVVEDAAQATVDWRYAEEVRSRWLPAGAQEAVDDHRWTRNALERNPKFKGMLPPEALFCWSLKNFSAYINSGGFVKPNVRCHCYVSPESPQGIVDLLEPELKAMNWAFSVDTEVGRNDNLTVQQHYDYHGMPLKFGSTVDKDDETETTAPIFIWEGCRQFIDHAPTLKYHGLVNRIVGINMHTKVGMLELVRERCIERDIPINFPPPWYPVTFALPDDLTQWKKYAESRPTKKWLYKPTGESMGRGIILVNKISDVDSRERPFRTRCRDVEVFDPRESPLEQRDFASSGVIQEYLVNPLLLDNRKFAVRVFMLVARVKPFLAFHYNSGYVKRCGNHYDENRFEQADLFRHITNQEIQKRQEGYENTEAAELMSIADLDAYLQENLGIVEFQMGFWDQVRAICMEICHGIKEPVELEGKQGMFEIFGLDFIVDAEQHVYLLEANRDPSWVMDSQVKKDVIPDMIREMLELVFWAQGDEGHGKEAVLSSPVRGFEVLVDEAFDYRAVDVE
eukprot:TRINITY_DN54835_c0_g1_i1.p1 TRINITY_DN54835_c0_g1~~TRINITY_DN54835_c0_g1_i1.p1  ORF type:complete len:534 (+),score=99.13 TRINITY_DN54835_c0_g1_i1:56-1603(+)